MKNIFSILFLIFLVFGVSSCSSDAKELEYNDTLNGIYDTDLMYQNLLKINNGDPGGLWVSEEDDPVYGGYCYVAITTLNNNLNKYEYPIVGFDPTNYDPNDETDAKVLKNVNNYYKGCGFEIYRSKDLSNWENCGAIDGSGLGIKRTDWIDTWTWAPELIRDEKGNKGEYCVYVRKHGIHSMGEIFSITFKP